MSSGNSNEKVVSTICNSHCGGTCVIKAHVRGDRIVRLETDDGEEPQLRACARGRAYRQRVYALIVFSTHLRGREQEGPGNSPGCPGTRRWKPWRMR